MSDCCYGFYGCGLPIVWTESEPNDPLQTPASQAVVVVQQEGKLVFTHP